jgi:hypothetical protein
MFQAINSKTNKTLYLDTACKRGIAFYLKHDENNYNCKFKIKVQGKSFKAELVATKSIKSGDILKAKSVANF